MQELSQFGGLRPAQLQSRHGRPITHGQSRHDSPRTWSQVPFLQVRLQTEFAQQFEFEGENRLWPRRLMLQVVEQTVHQFKHRRQRCLGLGDLLHELGAISSLLQTFEILPENAVSLADLFRHSSSLTRYVATTHKDMPAIGYRKMGIE